MSDLTACQEIAELRAEVELLQQRLSEAEEELHEWRSSQMATANVWLNERLQEKVKEIERLLAAMKAVASLAGRDWLIGQLALAEALENKMGDNLIYALVAFGDLTTPPTITDNEAARAAGGGDE